MNTQSDCRRADGLHPIGASFVRRVAGALLLVAFGSDVFWSDPVAAQVPDPQVVTSSVPISDQEFGYAVDLDGDVAVVGAFRDDDGSFALEMGAAYIYRFDGGAWNEEARLFSTMPGSFNWYGFDVAVSGDVVLVSESRSSVVGSNIGVVFVYRYDGVSWTQEALLSPSTPPVGNDGYGNAIDVDGDVIVVGESGRGVTVGDQGVVYVYRRDGAQWNEEAVLTGTDLSVQALFGSSVQLDGDRLLVGAFNANDSTSTQAGKVYVFDFDGAQWNQTGVLQSDASNNIANMGVSVALEGDWAVSGTPLDNERGAGAGAAFVHRFDGTNWVFHSKLMASDGSGFYLFGSSVAISGDRILVGADNWGPQGGDSSGKAYLFTYDAAGDTWTEAEGVVPPTPKRGMGFGHALAMQGEVMMIGAPEYDSTEVGMGAVFMYGMPQVATAVEAVVPEVGFSLHAPYPNPAVDRATIGIVAAETQQVRAAVYDLLGREVRVLHDGPVTGARQFEVFVRDMPAGLYLVRATAGPATFTRPLVVVR